MLPPPSMTIPDTLKGVDELIRADFEAFRALWFSRLLTATFLVVIGLVMEGPELWHEIQSILHRWNFSRRFHFSIPEAHTPDWAKLLAFAGWMFIVVGVAGEFVADSFVSKADGFVQKFDEILLADAQEKSGLAFERAAKTEKEAAADLKTTNLARQKAEEARLKAEGFQLQIANANERASGAEADAAEAKKQTEQERLERIRLEAVVQPRLLSLATQKQLADACKPFAGAGYSVEITTYIGDMEEAGLQASLIAGLKGIKVSGRSMMMVNGPPPDRGVMVIGNPGLVKVISQALEADHIKHEAAPVANQGTQVAIRIGPKPFDLLP